MSLMPTVMNLPLRIATAATRAGAGTGYTTTTHNGSSVERAKLTGVRTEVSALRACRTCLSPAADTRWGVSGPRNTARTVIAGPTIGCYSFRAILVRPLNKTVCCSHCRGRSNQCQHRSEYTFHGLYLGFWGFLFRARQMPTWTPSKTITPAIKTSPLTVLNRLGRVSSE